MNGIYHLSATMVNLLAGEAAKGRNSKKKERAQLSCRACSRILLAPVPRSSEKEKEESGEMTAPSSSFKEEGRGGGGGGRSSSGTLGYRRVPLRRLFRAGSVACGVQFGWALQLSLLTPYVQELGIPHAWSSLVWLCGPVSGMVVQPLVGHLSDRCASPWGRRRPFIAGGALAIALAVVTIGYSSDIGSLLGDSPTARLRPRAITVFVLGFWLLDVANNLIQGPCRALLADFTGKRASSGLFTRLFF